MKDKPKQLNFKILLLLPGCYLSRTSISSEYFCQQKVRCHLISPRAESCTSRDCMNLETWHVTVLFGSSIWVGFLLGVEEIAVVPAHSSQGSSLSFIIIFVILLHLQPFRRWILRFPHQLAECLSFQIMLNSHMNDSYSVVSNSLFCDHMDRSLPGFSVHGFLQARILDWVAISFSVTLIIITKFYQNCIVKTLS